MNHQLLIIGGGAAGLIAAVTAYDLGVDVAIIESNDRIGRKILTTGNGRCNISNQTIDESMERHYHSGNRNFPHQVLETFSVGDTIAFFEMLGLPLVTLEEGRMYPLSLQASSVLDIFRLALEERGIPLYLKHKATEITPQPKDESSGFLVQCRTDEGDRALRSEKILLCAGGQAAPQTGSDGSGYSLAKALGHRVNTPLPALVQLKLDNLHLKALSGVKFEGLASLLVNSRPEESQFGEILFTDYGISGPPILSLSRHASTALAEESEATITIDIMPAKTEDELKELLENHWGLLSHRSVHDSLIGIINKKLIPTLLKEAAISNMHKPCYELDWKERLAIRRLMKAWSFRVTDTNSFRNAQVTAGGIDTSDVDEQTLESKIMPGLYFAGEILDVDGDCGGYNLQWAWSSGAVAARSSSLRSRQN